MGLGRFAPSKVTAWMDDLEAEDIWLSLVSSDPLATASPYTAELVGGTVARLASSWTRTSFNLMTLDEPLSFVGLPAGAYLAGVAAFDAAVNGNLLFADLLDQPLGFPAGGSYTLPAGEYVVGIDVPGT